MIKIAEAKQWDGQEAEVVLDDGTVKVGMVTYTPKDGDKPSGVSVKNAGRGRALWRPLSVVATIGPVPTAQKNGVRPGAAKVSAKTPTRTAAPKTGARKPAEETYTDALTGETLVKSKTIAITDGATGKQYFVNRESFIETIQMCEYGIDSEAGQSLGEDAEIVREVRAQRTTKAVKAPVKAATRATARPVSRKTGTATKAPVRKRTAA